MPVAPTTAAEWDDLAARAIRWPECFTLSFPLGHRGCFLVHDEIRELLVCCRTPDGPGWACRRPKIAETPTQHV